MATKDFSEWVTSATLAEMADISPRAARAYASRHAALGLLKEIRVFPGFRYKFVAHVDQPGAAQRHAAKLAEVAAAIGLNQIGKRETG